VAARTQPAPVVVAGWVGQIAVILARHNARMTICVERERLRLAETGEEPWLAWGPYLSERAWGTVREDYSEHGTAWDYFPHDHARSRAYRWNEDGLAGICDDQQTFCFALAFWNGQDPILKERIFGLNNHEGNHGEDAKEHWWYLDSTPTHSWMRWRYHYPQAAFPYRDLLAVNAERRREEPEYELLDTGVFDDDRYWAVTVDYAKATPTDLAIRITVANRGPEPASLDLLPTLWFRNTWSWGPADAEHSPLIRGIGETVVAEHRTLGRLVLGGTPGAEVLCCDNESNAERLWDRPNRTPYPKDGINDHVVAGADTVNPDREGTKAALHYRLEVPAGGSTEVRLRLVLTGPADYQVPVPPSLALGDGLTEVLAAREAQADAFFAELTPAGVGTDEARVLRQAVAGLMWGKQFFHFDVARWLDGDPASDPPPAQRRTSRNSHWRHLRSADVISMPDPWEYPWFAAWDLAFHCVALAKVDPGFAKAQLRLLLRDWYQHPNGQIPAYEWSFDDVNPPAQAWAALQVFEIDGGGDYDFLARVMHKLLINFTWWVNRKDTNDNNAFEGGFLGLDNVGPFDRSAVLPIAGRLEQSDATGWMGMYALNLLRMAVVLAVHDRTYEDLATKFFEHFAYIARAAYVQELWDPDSCFFYDVLRGSDGTSTPLRVRSVAGLLPLCATLMLDTATLSRLPDLSARMRWFLTEQPQYADVMGARWLRGGRQRYLLSMVGPDRLLAILVRLLDEEEFLSPYGLRSMSRGHRKAPFTVELGGNEFTVGYEPAESRSGSFGGNSSWRGPIWFPVNYLLIGALREYAEYFGDDLLVSYPSRSDTKHTLREVADDLSHRLVSLFLDDTDGRRPLFGGVRLLQEHPDWHDLLPFPEYFHGDNGAGLGASHQTGWTALVANLIIDTRR
jgi:hypothetical protein